MKDLTNKTSFINAVLWLAFVLAMVSSVQHIAWTFGTVEQPGREWLGWIPAIAVDAGLGALAYTIQQRRKVNKSVAVLWGGVAFFAAISALANLYHALVVESGGITSLSAIGAIDALLIIKAIFLSATLPALVIYLSEIVSGDDATQAKAMETQAERERMKEERQQKRLDMQAEREAAEAKRLLLEAENERARMEQAAKVSEPEPAQKFYHPACGRSFASQNALNAHLNRCNVVHSTEISEISPEHPNGKAGK